jgi:molybdate transport system substrate-binding protein
MVGLLLVWTLAACTTAAGRGGVGTDTLATTPGVGSPEPGAIELTVFGAASLRGVLERLRDAYAVAVPGTSIVVSTDSSAALATQIEQGAPADVFLSADQDQPRRLIDGGLVDGSPVSFAANELSVITPVGNPGGLASPANIGDPGVTIIAAGDHVPITGYATRLIDRLARQPGYPADLATRYAANVASREDNVKAVLAKVELGEGDAGIVYRTDAIASSKVDTLDLPEAANVTATYDAVVIAGSRHRDAARAFLDWLLGPDGQAILIDDGFIAPS